MESKYQYTEEIADKILRRLKAGQMITKICEDKSLVPLYIVADWLDVTETSYKPDFAKRYHSTRKMAAEVHHSKTLTVIDDALDNLRLDKYGNVDNGWVKLIIAKANTHRLIASLYSEKYNTARVFNEFAIDDKAIIDI